MSSTSEQNNCDAHLQAAAAEIEALKQALHEKQNQLLAMESACLRETDRQVELEDSVIAWQDKYDRLYDSHKRVQKVNQSLEDKLLKMVDRNAGERAQLTSDVATLSVRLAQANYNIAKLQREIERYKTDINLAIQLLQCKPDSFVSQKVSSLPIDIQSKVSSYMRLETNSHSDSEGSTSGVGVATSGSYKVLPASDSPPPACPFPPTAMVYSMRGLDGKSNSSSTINIHSNSNCTNNNNNSNNNNMDNNNSNKNNNNSNNNNNINTTINSPVSNTHHTTNTSTILNNNNNNITTNGLNTDHDMISPSIMAKFLEEELKASEIKHCDTCQCANKDLTVLADVSRSYSVSTQTPFSTSSTVTNLNEPLTALCLRCNSNLNSPSRTNSPYLMKLVKSSDSVISETKSSVSDLNDVDKLFTPAKREDLMVNPILGHHRLCDRTAGSGALNGGSHLTNGHKFTYPTSSLVNYQASYTSDTATKYILETCNTPVSNGNGSSYQRRFLDGGGTALDLLEYRTKYDASNTPKLDGFKRQQLNVDGNSGMDDIEDEAKPLLSGISQSNLHENEKKFEQEHGVKTISSSVCDSVSNNNKNNSGLTKTAISGSVNSIWSKTSSCEGAKMFENFNRNLIKTIKAENPKYRGPRLCAMRIQQNGQSNVLLDNIESIEAVTPVIYTRRERFLDEELDDTKDIITSRTSATTALMQEPNELDISESISGEEQSKPIDKDEPQNQEMNGVNQTTEQLSREDMEENKISEKCDLSDNGGGLTVNSKGAVPDIVETHSAKEVKTLPEDETALLVHNVKLVPSLPLEYTAAEQDSDRKLTNSYREQHHKSLISSEQQQQLLKASLNYDVLHKNDVSCKNSQKSYTQSSSISDVIDFQESVLLRRQQLSRVAEWVQNNSQQLQEQQQQEQQQQPMMTTTINHGGGSSGTTDQQSSYSTMDQYDSISIEKLSMDSGYKTTPQLQTNGYAEAHTNDEAVLKAEDELLVAKRCHNIKTNTNTSSSCKTSNTFFRRTGRSGLPIAYNALPDTQTNNSGVVISHHSAEQPTTCDILNYKYYPSDSDRSLAIKAELHTTTQHVDIAQMEYNVKQFLLKQNEWSIRNSRSNTATTASRSSCTNLSTVTAQKYLSCNIASKQQQQQATTKTLRQSKLFNSSGIGPGIGERVLVKTVTTVAAAPTIATTVTGTAMTATTSDSQQRPTPHRTETNL